MVQNLTFVLKRRWLLLVIMPIAITAAVVLLAPTPGKPEQEYRSRAYLAARPSDSSTVTLEQAALDIVQLPIGRAAAEELNRPPEDARDIVDMLDVDVQEEALTLEITATSTVRGEPEPLVRAVALVYSATINGELLESFEAEVEQAREVVSSAESELETFNLANPPLPADVATDVQVEAERQARIDAVSLARQNLADLEAQPPPEDELRLVGVDPDERAPEPKLQLPANRAARGTIAFLLGLIGAVGVAAFLERFNPRIDDANDAQRIVGAPVLAAVPVVGRRQRGMLSRARLDDFSGPFAEAFRGMRSHLDYLTASEGRKVEPRVMMVSAAPGEGKSTSSAFLALAYLETGRDVLVVGGDMRRPSVHRLFDVPRSPGLSSRLLGGPDAPSLPDLVVRDRLTGAAIVPSGPSTSRVTGLLHDLNALVTTAQESGRAVIVDSPPVVVANDAIDFLPCVDWVVVVVRTGVTSERAVKAAMQQLELNQAKVIGCVLVGSLESSDAKRYYYGYYDTTDTIAHRLNRAPNGSEPDEKGSETSRKDDEDDVEVGGR